VGPFCAPITSQGRNDGLVTADEAEIKVDFAKGNLQIVMSNVFFVAGDGDRAYMEKKSFSVPLSAIDTSP